MKIRVCADKSMCRLEYVQKFLLVQGTHFLREKRFPCDKMPKKLKNAGVPFIKKNPKSEKKWWFVTFSRGDVLVNKG